MEEEGRLRRRGWFQEEEDEEESNWSSELILGKFNGFYGELGTSGVVIFRILIYFLFQIEKYAPGLPQKIKVNSVKAWVFLSNSSYDLFSASRTFVNEKVLM